MLILKRIKQRSQSLEPADGMVKTQSYEATMDNREGTNKSVIKSHDFDRTKCVEFNVVEFLRVYVCGIDFQDER